MDDFIVVTKKEQIDMRYKIEVLAGIILEQANEIRSYRKTLKEINHKSHKEFMDRQNG